MSLAVRDHRSRGRSKSPGRRDERSRSRDIRAPSPQAKSRKSSKKYYSDESDSGSRSRKNHSKKYYSDESSSESDRRLRKKSSKKYYEEESSESGDRRRKKHSKKRYEEEDDESSSESGSDRRRPQKSSKSKAEAAESRHRRESPPGDHSKHSRKGEYTQSSKPQYERERREGRHASYAEPERYEHARPTEYTRHLSYSSTEGSGHERPGHTLPGQFKWEYDHSPEGYERGYRPNPMSGAEQSRHLSMSTSGNFNVSLGGGHQPYPPNQPTSPTYIQSHYGYPSASARPENQRAHSGSIGTKAPYQLMDPPQNVSYAPKMDARRPSYTQSARPQFVEVKPHDVEHKLQRLSISGGTAGAMSLTAPSHNNSQMHGGIPPGSPLLESYHGTYQSISPMPSPLMLPSNVDDDMSDLDQLSSKDSSDDPTALITTQSKSTKKRVSFYNPEPDALALAAALKHTKPDSEPIISILPRLSDDHILELRTEYKKHIKVGGKGINIAKHIKMKVTGNLGKIAYAVALGRWESEAHWANFWYQSNTSRRELLIESLMGRTNSEIVKIKDAFSDKRYDDSLEKCMQTELKKDKFRNAVLLALEERRMPENEKLSIDLVRRDVHDLYRALTAKEGGETAMINIIVVRSDNHLREVLRIFEDTYKKNFAREMIKKSQNLVGETLAHILNGVLNRPVRDALLLHQALAETSKDRTELLVSRLVRFHWEPRHFEKIKVEYKKKYGSRLEHDLAEGTKGEFGDFCKELAKGEK
ncbi:MAG: hypothetical protein Q9191_000083 [Dirinaria sp. TL-2023a]